MTTFSFPRCPALCAAAVFALATSSTASLAQSPAAAPPTAAKADDTIVSARDRAFIASKMYDAISTYFAHFQTIPDYDREKSYAAFLDAAFAAPTRYEFDLACLEYLATLHNGHSGFSDPWLNTTRGKSFGFRAAFVENRWVVVFSRIPDLKVGDVLETLDGKPVEAWFQEKKKYLGVSSETAARTQFFGQRYLFPDSFEVGVAGGRKVAIKRLEPVFTDQKTTGKWLTENKTALIKIPSFDDPQFEKDAVALVEQYKNAATLIVDVRGNGGGSTPSRLIDALMDRPYRGASTASPLGVAVWKVRADYYDQISHDPKVPHDSDYGYFETMKDLSRNAMFYQPSMPQKPEKPLFTGKVIILIDRNVASAAEDFCIPFKDNHRATMIGEPSYGSTGQPYYYAFPNGMNFRISSKRDSFPDGSPFEGIGIVPDVTVPTTIENVRSGKDAVLEKAVERAR